MILEEIATAIELKDYKTAIRLLEPLIKTDPDNPKVKYYAAQIYEAQGKLETARSLYRQLLAASSNLQFMTRVRQSLKRLENREKAERAQAIEEAKARSGGTEPGVLILEPIAPEVKQEVAPKFAKIVQLDPYIARLQLPSRGWRLYRTGAIGELNYLIAQLKKVKIPCFCQSLTALSKLEVLEVLYFTSADSEIVARCQNQAGHSGTIAFKASEVSHFVEGRVPLFESVVTVDVRHKLQRKTQTQDYVQFFDLHLSSRNCLLRICERNYQFQQGILAAESPRDRGTVNNSWQVLMQFLRPQLSRATAYSDFTPFAETALGFRETLSHIKPCIHLKRREESLWDSAFQLYSTLAFARSRS